MNSRFLTAIGVLLGLALVLGVGSCIAVSPSFQKPEANQWGCSFGKGPFDERGLKNIIAPGGNGGLSNDTLKTGPSDVRFYIVDSDPNTADFGGRPIVVPARGSVDTGVGVVNVSVEVQVRFVFNENFCDWYINHGKRNEPLNYEADSGEASGWNTFLNASMNQKLIEGARTPLAPESYIDLYVNAPLGDDGPAYEVLGQQLSANLSRELERDLGGSYFCGPTYQFDGEADGELATGCPPLEVTIKRIVPVDSELISRLEQIVANEEQERLISSNQQRRLAEIAAQEAEETREQERRQEVEVAQAEANEAIGTAKAQSDLAIAQAQEQVFAQDLENERLQAEADAAFCVQLAAQGVDCALYEAAKTGSYPRIVLSDSDAVELLVEP